MPNRLTATGIPTAHVRLGFDERRIPSARSDARGLVSFVGAPLPARTDALTRLQQEGLPVRAWGADGRTILSIEHAPGDCTAAESLMGEMWPTRTRLRSCATRLRP